MEIFETVWEFLTFERVCLAIIIWFQFNLLENIQDECKRTRNDVVAKMTRVQTEIQEHLTYLQR